MSDFKDLFLLISLISAFYLLFIPETYEFTKLEKEFRIILGLISLLVAYFIYKNFSMVS